MTSTLSLPQSSEHALASLMLSSATWSVFPGWVTPYQRPLSPFEIRLVIKGLAITLSRGPGFEPYSVSPLMTIVALTQAKPAGAKAFFVWGRTRVRCAIHFT